MKKLRVIFGLFVLLFSVATSTMSNVAYSTTTNTNQSPIESSTISDSEDEVQQTETTVTTSQSAETANSPGSDSLLPQTTTNTENQPRAPALIAIASAEIGNIITKSTLSDSNGNPINDVNQFTDFQMNFDFTLPNNTVKAGDQTTIKLSDNIKFLKGETFDVKDANGNVIAKAVIDPATKTLTMTYTDYAETHSDVKGSLHLTVRIDTEKVKENGKVPITFTENGTEKPVQDVNYGKFGDSTDEKFMKYGYFLNDEGSKAQFVLRVNASGATYQDAVVWDSLRSDGIYYDPSSFVISKGTWKINESTGLQELTNVSDVTSQFPVKIAADGRSFEVDFGNINGEGYRIEYKTNINHALANGELFRNWSQLRANNTLVDERVSDIIYQRAGGGGEGYNYSIKIHKTDEAGNPLVGAEFTVTRDSTGALFGTITTGGNGDAELSGLLKDNYTLKETQAPDGYAPIEEIKISPEDFGTDMAVQKTIVDKKLESPKIDISGKKIWDDNDNQDGKRPDTITVKLLANGVFKDSKTVSANDNWAYAFTDLPKNDENGQLISYTITEDSVSEYSVIYDGYNITNKLTPGSTSLDVTKSWDDKYNQDGIRPTSILVQLYADGQPKGDPVELNAGNNWHTVWNDLPEKSAGQTISYTVKESSTIPGYTTTVDDSNPGNVVITNVHTPEVTNVKGQKIWNDNNNSDGKRPDSINVNLLANGKVIQTIAVSAGSDNSWTYSFDNLPKYDDGTLIDYTVTEDSVPEYTTTYNGSTITNTHTPGKTSICATKSWDDQNDQDGIRPVSLQVQLFADGQAYGAPVTLNPANNWNHVWENLPEKKDGGQKIIYSVMEVEVPEGYVSTTNDNNLGNIILSNRHTPETTQISGEKIWDDKNNQDGKRPESIRVNLLANGKIVDTIDVKASDNWKYTFTNLPKNENGQAINYTVTEDRIDDYSTTYEGNNIVNSYTPNKTNFNVTKSWNDKNDQDGKRPTNVKVQLYANGKEIGAPVELNATNNWTYNWQDLDEMSNGQKIVYTVKEVSTPSGYTSTQNVSSSGNVIINSHEPEVTKVEGEKSWDDNDNQDGKRPASIKVYLFGNGKVVDTVEVSENESWKYSFDNLPKYANGELINYTVVEDRIGDYNTNYNGHSITNSYTTEKTNISVTKAWNDKDDQDGLRPASIFVQLYANGVAKGEQVELNEANNWKHNWADLEKMSNGQAINYTVKEVETPSGYTSTQSANNPGNVILSNNHEPETTQVEGEKIWKDADNQDGKRPDKITVNLLADGEIIDSKEVSASDNWKYAFTNLPKFSHGKEILYSVKEDKITDYSTSYDGYNITNSYTPGKTSISVTKAWNDKDNQDGLRPTGILVQLYADGKALGSPVDLNAANNWSKNWQNLDEMSKGKKIIYTVKEVEAPSGYTVTQSESSPGNIIISNTHEPEKTQVEGQKLWKDADNQDGKRPNKITVNLLADGKIIDSKEVSAADNWKYSFTDLPKFNQGQKILYTVKENQVADYSSSYDGYNITNSYTPGKTSISVTKAWNDKNNQDALRPASIKVQLYADDKALGEAVTLDNGNKWTKTWQDLPEKSAGKTIKYTVKEVGSVKGYTISVNNDNPGNIVITNSHTPEIPNIPNKPNKPNKPNNPDNPNKPNKPILPRTSDHNDLSIILAGGAILVLALLISRKVKKP
jgi:LPXTG-motif cell wall-anchored protein